VKIDLGAHIDGYIAVAAHTFVVNGGKKISGKAADVIAAAYTAQEAAYKLLKAGNKNSQVTPIIAKVCSDFKVSPVQGVLSHQMQRFVIDGEKVILNKEDTDNRVDVHAFEANEVYAIDVVVSSGEGKPKESEERVTVFKRKGSHLQAQARRLQEGIVRNIETIPLLSILFTFSRRKIGTIRNKRMC